MYRYDEIVAAGNQLNPAEINKAFENLEKVYPNLTQIQDCELVRLEQELNELNKYKVRYECLKEDV